MASVVSVVNGRFKVIYGGSLPAPGKCGVCGSVERDCIDFGLDVDYYGAVLLCVECISEAHSVAGLLASTQPTPLPSAAIDAGAINEYVRKSDDAVSRLLSLLPAPTAILDASPVNDEVVPSDITSESIGDPADIKIDGRGADKPSNTVSESFGF